MFIAVVVTLFDANVVDIRWIIAGIAAGTAIGIPAGLYVAMTSMPEMVGLLNGSGGIASLLVGWASYNANHNISAEEAITVFLSVVIGGITFSGSVVAWGKLKGVKWIPEKPWLFKGQNIVNSLMLILTIVLGVIYCVEPASFSSEIILMTLVVLSLLLGVFAVLPIGGADMPVVISLLNSYSGIAACMAGFVINNNLLIVTGALVGASGIILTMVMCKAMNRPITNVLFSGFGSGDAVAGKDVGGEMRAITPEDAYYILEAASTVVIAPGYGLAVAQAQHAVKELGDILEKRGTEVKYVIHPVAGRMPGHMNVLLAEANVSYDMLVEPADINPTMSNVDVCIVIGANDTVNPSARDDKTCPMYGMPIIEADKAKVVFCLKRGKGKGFSGVENPLFFKDNTRMLFGDAKSTVSQIIAQFKEA